MKAASVEETLEDLDAAHNNRKKRKVWKRFHSQNGGAIWLNSAEQMLGEKVEVEG
jgi:hypothetical protein